MVAVAATDTAPVVDNNVGAKRANYAHHIFEHLVAPNFFGLFRSLRKTKVRRAREKKLYSIAARGGEQFLRPDQAELRGLLPAEGVLPAFAARDGKKRHISVQAAREIGERRRRFIVGMSGNVKDARGGARAGGASPRFSPTGGGGRRAAGRGRG